MLATGNVATRKTDCVFCLCLPYWLLFHVTSILAASANLDEKYYATRESIEELRSLGTVII